MHAKDAKVGSNTFKAKKTLTTNHHHPRDEHTLRFFYNSQYAFVTLPLALKQKPRRVFPSIIIIASLHLIFANCFESFKGGLPRERERVRERLMDSVSVTDAVCEIRECCFTLS
jgi:hypothetical protein